jgi:hypothetical protein
MSAHAKNTEVQQTASHDVQDFSQRLALSALWMGVSMNLVLQQYLLGSSAAIIVASHTHPAAANDTMDTSPMAGPHSRVGKPADPLMMDILSTLIGSLQANEFVTRSTVDTKDDHKSVLELENILSMHNGVNIEYAKTSTPAQPHAHGILLIGDFDVDPNHQGDPSKRSSAIPSGIPVSVHNGVNLMKLMSQPVDTKGISVKK